MRPQTRPLSLWEIERCRLLRRGAAQGLLLWLAMRRAGIAGPGLMLIAVGMFLAANALEIAQLCQAGVIDPWPGTSSP